MSTLTAAGDPADETAEAGLDRVIALLADRRVAFLTGAGVSTDSGIPDYRGQGAPVRTPMTVDQFLSNDDAARKRYWAGSHLGWKRFDGARPNAGHRAIALLEEAGIADGVITQNVDGLHVRAGSRRVVDLLQTRTGDGYVLRVDLRLRPSPEVSPIAVPVGGAIAYYESSALTWERAAFIRARAAATSRCLEAAISSRIEGAARDGPPSGSPVIAMIPVNACSSAS